MKRLLLLVSFALLSSGAFAQVYLPEDTAICASKFRSFNKAEFFTKPINDVIAGVGKSFLGVDYVAHTLESDSAEELTVNLRGLDCTTFLENCLVLSRCIKKQKFSWNDYLSELQLVRYRQGRLDKYPSRLHYFSDWIFDNSKKGIVKDITGELGGEPIVFNVGFMTKNRNLYRQISKNDEFFGAIQQSEREISGRKYHYIPKDKIQSVEKGIGNGYLIAITSGIEGMDIAHVGVAVRMDDGRVHFMHAPIVGSKVQITEKPLSEYLKKNKKQTGIIVLQPIEP